MYLGSRFLIVNQHFVGEYLDDQIVSSCFGESFHFNAP